MDVFRKLVMLKCSMLAYSTDYDFKHNLNFIFVNVPSIQPGFEGLNWFSGMNESWRLYQDYGH
jgi:hypothetical protein